MQVRDLIAELKRFNQWDEVAIDTQSANGHVAIDAVDRTLYPSEFANGSRVYVSLVAGESIGDVDWDDAEDEIDRLQSKVDRLEKEISELKKPA